MKDPRLAGMEAKFAELIWQHAPVGSGQLVALCQQAFDWKKSTTYTMLKRLCGKGLFRNEGGIVEALISRDEYASLQSSQFVEEAFGGSLPRFFAAFPSRKKLTAAEVDELQRLIDEYKEG